MTAVLRDQLIAALAAHLDNDVVADVDGWRVPVTAVDYEPQTDLIVLRLDPEELAFALGDGEDEPTDPEEGNGNE